MSKQYKRIIIGGIVALVGGFILLQFLPVEDAGNPPVLREPEWDSPETRQLVVSACYDCHSNETRWPWYTRIAPVSMLLQRDVKEGRELLNFSEWIGGRNETETEEMVEVVSKGQMPPPYYLVLHPEARLSEEEKGRLINGLIATMGADPGGLDSDELDERE
jgi:hypothetical protein